MNSIVLRRGFGLRTLLATESTTLKLEAFTVSEPVRGQALAINQQKTASGLVNVVSEEAFNANLGGNIGFTLQQLPGLSVNEREEGEPSGVNIRGLEAKYNSVQVDGNRMPVSGNSRAFSVGQLNADSVSNIEVIKAATPDRDGDSLGGTINVTLAAHAEDIEIVQRAIEVPLLALVVVDAARGELDGATLASAPTNR